MSHFWEVSARIIKLLHCCYFYIFGKLDKNLKHKIRIILFLFLVLLMNVLNATERRIFVAFIYLLLCLLKFIWRHTLDKQVELDIFRKWHLENQNQEIVAGLNHLRQTQRFCWSNRSVQCHSLNWAWKAVSYLSYGAKKHHEISNMRFEKNV